MKTRLLALAVAGALAAQPVMTLPAAAQSNSNDSTLGISNENIGRILGGVGGALLGAQFGKGTGKLVAVAAGTIGGLFIGGEVAKYLTQKDQQGIAQTSQAALETGETQTWTNPDTGMTTTAAVEQVSYRPAPVTSADIGTSAGGGGGDISRLAWRVPTMQLIGADYASTTKTNVRGGPSTDYAVMDQLEKGERVHVVGKVANAKWYMISRNGIGKGFVHADLLRPVQNADYAVVRPQSSTPIDNVRQCSIITQTVQAPGGHNETRKAQACQRADGTWEMV